MKSSKISSYEFKFVNNVGNINLPEEFNTWTIFYEKNTFENCSI